MDPMIETSATGQVAFFYDAMASDYDLMTDSPARLPGLRVARGGSWDSVSRVFIAISDREPFRPQHSSQDIGCVLVARMLP